MGLLASASPGVRRDVRPVRRLPGVEPYDDFRPSRWCHGGILQSSGRSEALPATSALPGRGARARQFPISRWERRAPPVATPPGPLRGRGRRPSGGARSAAPRGLPISWASPECLPPKYIGGLPQTVMDPHEAKVRLEGDCPRDCSGRLHATRDCSRRQLRHGFGLQRAEVPPPSVGRLTDFFAIGSGN